jgi:uncharacterized protein
MNENRFEKLVSMTRSKYENNGDPGHDFAHILRVITTCRKIGISVGAHLDILLPAALLHDVVNVPKNHPDRMKASQQAAAEAAGILKTVGYSEEEIEHIQTVITEHSYSLGKKPSSIESAVLQDADRLDALGAVGIMRMVTCGSRMGSVYYDLGDPFASQRELDDKKFTIDHLYVKLFGLAKKMNTEPGLVEAAERVKFMESFVQQLGQEVKNEILGF